MWLCCEKNYNYVRLFFMHSISYYIICIDQHKKIVSFRNNGGLISASLNVIKITSETKNYHLLLTTI